MALNELAVVDVLGLTGVTDGTRLVVDIGMRVPGNVTLAVGAMIAFRGVTIVADLDLVDFADLADAELSARERRFPKLVIFSLLICLAAISSSFC